MKTLLLICILTLTTAIAEDCDGDPPKPPTPENGKAPEKPRPLQPVPPSKS